MSLPWEGFIMLVSLIFAHSQELTHHIFPSPLLSRKIFHPELYSCHIVWGTTLIQCTMGVLCIYVPVLFIYPNSRDFPLIIIFPALTTRSKLWCSVALRPTCVCSRQPWTWWRLAWTCMWLWTPVPRAPWLTGKHSTQGLTKPSDSL